MTLKTLAENSRTQKLFLEGTLFFETGETVKISKNETVSSIYIYLLFPYGSMT